MADPIRVHNLGEGGVNVDTSHLLTADNETRESQNATYLPTLERQGGLTKRAGFGRFNTVSFNEPVLGGCEAPYEGVATAAGGGGGGLPGENGGTGDTVRGGGTAPGDDVTFGSGGTQLQSSVTTGGVGGATIFGGRRLILIGRTRITGGVSNDNGTGWYLTSEQFQDAAWITGSLDSPEAIVGQGPPGASRLGVPGQTSSGMAQAAPGASAIVGGWLYYAKNIVTTAGTPTTDARGSIRRTNGYTDEQVAWIPSNPWNTDARQVSVVVSMLAANGGVYVCTCDKGQSLTGESVSTNPDWGRVFFINLTWNQNLAAAGIQQPALLALTEVNMDDPTAPVGFARAPYSLAWYLDRLFVGGYQSDGTENEATIHYSQPDLVPILDLKLDTPYFRASCMATYKGKLFAGYQMRDTGVGVIGFSTIRERVAAPSTPGADPWSTSLTATGGSAVAENLFASMVVFKDNLYASYFNFTQTAKIYKFDGTTWTTQYTASTAPTRAALYLFVDTNSAGTEILYAFGYSESSTMTWLSSTDGTTFTDRSTTLEAVTPHSTAAIFSASAALPVFYGFDQK